MSPETFIHDVPENLAHTGQAFVPFGIEALPTAATMNQICLYFILPYLDCKFGKFCMRIHPVNREVFLSAISHPLVQDWRAFQNTSTVPFNKPTKSEGVSVKEHGRQDGNIKGLEIIHSEDPSTELHALIRNHIHLSLGPGFQLTNISTGFESSSSVYLSGLPKTIRKDEVDALLADFGPVIRWKTSEDGRQIWVQFATASMAYRALFVFNKALYFKRALKCCFDVKQRMPGHSITETAITIDWDAPSFNAFLGYPNVESAKQAVQKLHNTQNRGFLITAEVINGISLVDRVTVKIPKFPFFGQPIASTTQAIVRFAQCSEVLTQNYRGRTVTVEDATEGVRKLVASQALTFELRPPPYRNGRMQACATFSTPCQAQQAAQALHGLKLDFLGGGTIIAKNTKSVAFYVRSDLFRKAAVEIEEFAKNVEICFGCSLAIIQSEAQVTLRLTGEDIKRLSLLKGMLERLLNGAKLERDGKLVWNEFFAQPDGIKFLKNLEQEHNGLTIENSLVKQKISMFGKSEDRRQAGEKVIAKIEQIRSQRSYVIPLPSRLPFLHQEIWRIAERYESKTIHLDPGKNTVTIWGNIKAFDEVMGIINSTQFQRWKSDQDPTLLCCNLPCPICLDMVSNPVTLACGHSWCRDCLKRYLTSAIEHKNFPLRCLGESNEDDSRCQELIKVEIARELLMTAQFDAVVDAAFSAHVQTHPEEFRFCPTPDCPQIYRWQKDSGGDRFVFRRCPSCLVTICFGCQSAAHYGVTCREMNNGDELLREWAANHDVKQCPKCKVTIEKRDGCNHMTCICGTHICWKCLGTFSDDKAIYSHMNEAHDGIYM